MYVHKYAEALSDAESCCKLDAYHSGKFQAKIQSLLSVGRYQDAFCFLECSCGLKHLNEDEKKVFTSTYRRFGESYFHMGDSFPAAIQENGKKSVIFNPVSNSATRRFYGVWLLVSFVNHSCAPNATRINAGEITRIHAAKPIEKGQEINIPYFSVLVPYSLREVSCKAFDFGGDCKCKRC
ncbi:hypothetical protein KI387_027821, partial [Taxus chinensis]